MHAGAVPFSHGFAIESWRSLSLLWNRSTSLSSPRFIFQIPQPCNRMGRSQDIHLDILLDWNLCTVGRDKLSFRYIHHLISSIAQMLLELLYWTLALCSISERKNILNEVSSPSATIVCLLQDLCQSIWQRKGHAFPRNVSVEWAYTSSNGFKLVLPFQFSCYIISIH